MFIYIEQLTLAAKNSNAWQEIFVFAIMAIIWLITGITKMKANKTARRRKDQADMRPADHENESFTKPTPFLRKQQLNARQLEQKFLNRTEKFRQQKRKRLHPQDQPDIKVQKIKQVKTPEPQKRTKDLNERFSDKTTLQKAIIFHEIISKPKALQDLDFPD